MRDSDGLVLARMRLGDAVMDRVSTQFPTEIGRRETQRRSVKFSLKHRAGLR